MVVSVGQMKLFLLALELAAWWMVFEWLPVLDLGSVGRVRIFGALGEYLLRLGYCMGVCREIARSKVACQEGET